MGNRAYLVIFAALISLGVSYFTVNIIRFYNSEEFSNEEDNYVSDESDEQDGAIKGINLYSLLKSYAVIDDSPSEYVENSFGIDFSKKSSDINGKGLYLLSTTSNLAKPVLYYRGNVDNNNVMFAGFCWKIVRTTETGGIKLLYNGVSSNGKCLGNSYTIGMSSFNDGEGALYLGSYMYGDIYEDIEYDVENSANFIYGNDVTYSNNEYILKNTYISKNGYLADQDRISEKYHYTCFSTTNACEVVYYIRYPEYNDSPLVVKLENGKKIEDVVKSSTYESSNENDSNIKEYIDIWYENNLFNYEDYLEDSIWCNDRSIYKMGVYDKDKKYTLLYFGFNERENSNLIDLKCPNSNDSFTVNNDLGNMNLFYPIGLLTADELKLAGLTDENDTSNYLYSDKPWWTMTPSRQLGKYLDIYAANNINGSETADTRLSVRPAITLKSGIAIEKGTGTENDPYVIAK